MTERPDFTQRFSAIKERLGRGEISRRRAAKELRIGYATLKRLLDSQPLSPAVINDINSAKELVEVLY